jgi:hypothetical protein
MPQPEAQSQAYPADTATGSGPLAPRPPGREARPAGAPTRAGVLPVAIRQCPSLGTQAPSPAAAGPGAGGQLPSSSCACETPAGRRRLMCLCSLQLEVQVERRSGCQYYWPGAPCHRDFGLRLWALAVCQLHARPGGARGPPRACHCSVRVNGWPQAALQLPSRCGCSQCHWQPHTTIHPMIQSTLRLG